MAENSCIISWSNSYACAPMHCCRWQTLISCSCRNHVVCTERGVGTSPLCHSFKLVDVTPKTVAPVIVSGAVSEAVWQTYVNDTSRGIMNVSAPPATPFWDNAQLWQVSPRPGCVLYLHLAQPPRNPLSHVVCSLHPHAAACAALPQTSNTCVVMGRGCCEHEHSSPAPCHHPWYPCFASIDHQTCHAVGPCQPSGCVLATTTG